MSSVAVVDLETTGLNPYRHDRIVELAVLVIRPDGETLREFVTLVNPERDVGPTHIHGLTSSDVIAAPRFGDIAGVLLELLDGCVALAGHNVRFDLSFITHEFQRLGFELPNVPTLCTMHLAGGGSLSCACSDYGISVDGEYHTALHDGRAAAQLLLTLLKDAPLRASEISHLPPVVWPEIPSSPLRALTRDRVRKFNPEPPTYLQKLLARAQPDIPADNENTAGDAYSALLTRVLEDRHVTEDEGRSLWELATRWEIPAAQIHKIHKDYLQGLAVAAVADGTLTSSERRDLRLVSSLLGIDDRRLDEILNIAVQEAERFKSAPATNAVVSGGQNFRGKQVCFTGEFQCQLGGQRITREMATEIATRHGMVVIESVTKKLDFLVLADPFTQSGKAKRARQYGIRVIHERVFWNTVGLRVG